MVLWGISQLISKFMILSYYRQDHLSIVSMDGCSFNMLRMLRKRFVLDIFFLKADHYLCVGIVRGPTIVHRIHTHGQVQTQR